MRRAVLLLGCAVGLVVVVVLVPGWLVDSDLGGAHVTAQDRLNAVDTTRTTLLQAVGGMVLLYGAYVGWRQLRISQDTLRATQDGHLTDRFSRAVEQLGSGNLDVRIGGLHSLRRIADQSPDERDAVISIHAAYLRRHLRWPPGPEAPSQHAALKDVGELEERAADCQVALTGLGILCMKRQERWVNLSRVDLRLADCDGLWFTEVNLDGAWAESAGCYLTNFTLSSLIGTTLRRANMTRAILDEALCRGTDLRGAQLVHASLRGTVFEGADLREAVLRKAEARGADFSDADLRKADLRGADLTDAKLATARLAEAKVSDLTKWPAGFDWEAAGAVLVPDFGVEQGPMRQAVGVYVHDDPLESLRS